MKMDIKGTTRVCGLIGHPVHHTLSPAIHNTLSELTDTDMVYVPFEVQEDDVEAAIKGALALDIQGLNVTVPHKSTVIKYLKEIDRAAEQIGAVNTLVRTGDGSGFKGYNTDYFGILMSLEEKGIKLSGKSVIILGAGGASKPAAFLCADEGAEKVYILNRTFERASELAGAVNAYAGRDIAEAVGLSDYGRIPGDRKYICFQMTKVGLSPEVDHAVIEDPYFYEKLEVGFDAVYSPLNTKFLQLCEASGALRISGLKMLLYQGTRAYELWNDVKISRKQNDYVYGRLLGQLLNGKNIILTGFMGSGKSSVAKRLCKYLGYEMLDSDAEIEKLQRTTINNIFEQKGEEAFRDMETEYVKDLALSGKRGVVLSVGGGLPVREENRELLKQLGTVIFLKATPETVYERVKNDKTRPLLKSDDVMTRIKELQEKRRDVYTAAADFEIDTDDGSIEQIADRIIGMLL